MDFLAALLGALVGALGGGYATYLAATAQWRRDRRTATMETFYSQAFVWIDAVHPYTGSRNRGTVTSDTLLHSAVMLSLHAPKRVQDAAFAITADVSGVVENYYGPDPDSDLVDYERLTALLKVYETEMRKSLRLQKKAED